LESRRERVAFFVTQKQGVSLLVRFFLMTCHQQHLTSGRLGRVWMLIKGTGGFSEQLKITAKLG
jgi:hypothetical protein